ncbi:hypothetical protein ANTQUA_LOCUS3633 [Anthophora quadrimaculata]
MTNVEERDISVLLHEEMTLKGLNESLKRMYNLLTRTRVKQKNQVFSKRVEIKREEKKEMKMIYHREKWKRIVSKNL